MDRRRRPGHDDGRHAEEGHRPRLTPAGVARTGDAGGRAEPPEAPARLGLVGVCAVVTAACTAGAAGSGAAGGARPGGRGSGAPLGAPKLAVDVIAAGLTTPGTSSSPDGTLLADERPGRLVAPAPTAPSARSPPTSPICSSQGETGLMGLALDPDFDPNPRFYTCQASRRGGGRRDRGGRLDG